MSKETVNAVEEGRKNARADFITSLNNKRKELSDFRDSFRNVMVGNGFIVVSGGVPLKFTVEDKQVTNPRMAGGVVLATRFSKIDAESVAAATFDGASRPAEALHVTVAAERAIAAIDSVLGDFPAL